MWVKAKIDFEVYLLFWFIIIWIPIWIFTSYRFNVIIMFLQSTQIMYALFAFLPSIGAEFQIYFKNYMFLSFGARDFWIFIKILIFESYDSRAIDDYDKVIYSFPEVIFIIILFIILNSRQNKWSFESKWKWRIKSLFFVWAFLIYQFLSISIFKNLITSFSFSSLTDTLSVLLSVILLIWGILFVHCWIFNHKSKWFLWQRLIVFQRIRISMSTFIEIKQEYFTKFFLANLAKRLLICAFLIINVNGYMLFVYIGK